MSNVRGKIFCQRCKTGNELGQDLCARCGTRLMLLVETSTARFEERNAAAGMEEHLLERVTAIENNISRLIDKLEQMAELMLRGSRSAYIDHALLETLVAVLTESGLIDRRKLEAAWRERSAADDALAESKRRRKELTEKILGEYKGKEREQFTRLVGKGFEAHSKGREAEGVRALERASALAGPNLPLDIFLGQHFFRGGRSARARGYFARAHEADSENALLKLLLGLACADAGEAARARELLRVAVSRLGPRFAASVALGMLHAAESDWPSAYGEFECALAVRECPESYYLFGLAQYNLGRFAKARAALKKAVKLAPEYAPAQYLLALAHLAGGDREAASRALEAAAGADERFRPARRTLARSKGDVAKLAAKLPAPSLFGARGRRSLLTGGDERLAAAIRADALAEPTRR
jgi:tetratricopeptide (TPR) repeat protein